MSPAFFCSYLGKHLRLWQSAGIIPLQSPLPASHVEGLQFNGYRDWKFVHLLLALAPSSSHLSVFLVARKGDTRQEAEPLPRWLPAPSRWACLCHALSSGSNNIHHYYTFGSWFFPMLSSWVLWVFNFFFVVIFLFNHGPKGRRQYFIYSVTQLVRGKDVCVRHVNINQNLRSSFSTDILSTAPKEV